MRLFHVFSSAEGDHEGTSIVGAGRRRRLSLGGCQTLTEELPTQAPTARAPPIPVVPPVVSPGPDTATPEPPSGGGAAATRLQPGSRPTGRRTRRRRQVPNNKPAVVKVGAKVYFLECNGQQVPGSECATQAQVGCRIHFDCTPKDAQQQPHAVPGPPELDLQRPEPRRRRQPERLHAHGHGQAAPGT